MTELTEKLRGAGKWLEKNWQEPASKVFLEAANRIERLEVVVEAARFCLRTGHGRPALESAMEQLDSVDDWRKKK